MCYFSKQFFHIVYKCVCWDTDFLFMCVSVSEEHQCSHQVTSYLEVSELTTSALCTSPLQGSSPGQAHLLMHIILQTHLCYHLFLKFTPILKSQTTAKNHANTWVWWVLQKRADGGHLTLGATKNHRF